MSCASLRKLEVFQSAVWMGLSAFFLLQSNFREELNLPILCFIVSMLWYKGVVISHKALIREVANEFWTAPFIPRPGDFGTPVTSQSVATQLFGNAPVMPAAFPDPPHAALAKKEEKESRDEQG